MGIIFQTCLNSTMNQNLGDKVQVDLDIKVSQPNNQPPSPTFGPVKKVPVSEGMQRVGKHGKSHHEYLKVMNEHKVVDNTRQITLAQLSEHKTQQSAWLSLNGVVYDVTVYLHYHPGGDILLQGCGKECSQLFNQYHPWVNGKYLLQKYKIGFLK